MAGFFLNLALDSRILLLYFTKFYIKEYHDKGGGSIRADFGHHSNFVQNL